MSKNVYISYSKVSTFKSCPQRYYLEKSYPSDKNASALPFGSAIEAGVDELLKGKTLEEAVARFEKEWHTASKNRWEDAKKIWDNEEIFYYASDYDKKLITSDDLRQVEDWFSSIKSKKKEKTWDKQMGKFQGQVKNDAYISSEDRKFAHRVIWTCCLNRGKLMLEAFQRDLLPEIEEVVATQKDIQVVNEEGDKLVGIIDYIFKLKGHEKLILIDLKTAGRPYTLHDLNTSDQLSIYGAVEGVGSVGYMVLLKSIKYERTCTNCGGEPPSAQKKLCDKVACKKKKARYDNVTSKAETQLITRDLREEESEEIFDDFSDVLVAIKNEVNWKNPSSCFNFGKRCEYYDFCWGGKSLDEIPGIKKKGS